METYWESEYQPTLDYEAKKWYKELSVESEIPTDPYSLSEEEWIDDVTKWPSIKFGDVYNYLINLKGRYTKESLKAYKLKEHNQGYSYKLKEHNHNNFEGM